MNLERKKNRLTGFIGKKGKAIKGAALLIGLLGLLSVFAGTAIARDVHVRGHYRSNGVYVPPHYRSAPDRSYRNNWSTYPNVNPYTGRQGTRRGYGNYSRNYGRYYFPGLRTRSGRVW